MKLYVRISPLGIYLFVTAKSWNTPHLRYILYQKVNPKRKFHGFAHVFCVVPPQTPYCTFRFTAIDNLRSPLFIQLQLDHPFLTWLGGPLSVVGAVRRCSAVEAVRRCSAVGAVMRCSAVEVGRRCSAVRAVRRCSAVGEIRWCSAVEAVKRCSAVGAVRRCSAVGTVWAGRRCSAVGAVRRCSAI